MRASGRWNTWRFRGILLFVLMAIVAPSVVSGQVTVETCSEVHITVTITKDWGAVDAARINPVDITLPAGITYIGGDSTVTLGTTSPNVYTVPVSAGSSNSWNIEALQPGFILPADESEALIIEFEAAVASDAVSGDMGASVRYWNVAGTWAGTHTENIPITVNPTTPDCTIATPDTVCAGVEVNASVDPVPGATYVWTVTGGTLVSGQGTDAITWRSGSSGTATISVDIDNGTGCECNESTDVGIVGPQDGQLLMGLSAGIVGGPTTQIGVCSTGRLFIEGVNTTADPFGSIVVEDLLPENFAYAGNATITMGGASFSREPAVNGRNLNWDLTDQTLPAGETIRIEFDVSPSCGAYGEEAHHEADISFIGGTACYTVNAESGNMVTEAPSLLISKVPESPQQEPGDVFTWTVRIENAGFGDAFGVRVSDTLGLALEYIQIGGARLNGSPYSLPAPAVTGGDPDPTVLAWDLDSLTLRGRNHGGPDVLEIDVQVRILNCERAAMTNTINADTGCNGDICSENEATFSVNLTYDLPDITQTVEFANTDQHQICGNYAYVSACEPATARITLTNEGEGDALNVHYRFGLQYPRYTEWYMYNWRVESAPAGSTVTAPADFDPPADPEGYDDSNGIKTFNEYSSSQMVDNGYGDEVYSYWWQVDRIPPGESVIILIDYRFVCNWLDHLVRSSASWWPQSYRNTRRNIHFEDSCNEPRDVETFDAYFTDSSPTSNRTYAVYPEVRSPSKTGQAVMDSSGTSYYEITFQLPWWAVATRSDNSEIDCDPSTNWELILEDVLPPGVFLDTNREVERVNISTGDPIDSLPAEYFTFDAATRTLQVDIGGIKDAFHRGCDAWVRLRIPVLTGDPCVSGVYTNTAQFRTGDCCGCEPYFIDETTLDSVVLCPGPCEGVSGESLVVEREVNGTWQEVERSLPGDTMRYTATYRVNLSTLPQIDAARVYHEFWTNLDDTFTNPALTITAAEVFINGTSIGMVTPTCDAENENGRQDGAGSGRCYWDIPGPLVDNDEIRLVYEAETQCYGTTPGNEEELEWLFSYLFGEDPADPENTRCGPSANLQQIVRYYYNWITNYQPQGQYQLETCVPSQEMLFRADQFDREPSDPFPDENRQYSTNYLFQVDLAPGLEYANDETDISGIGPVQDARLRYYTRATGWVNILEVPPVITTHSAGGQRLTWAIDENGDITDGNGVVHHLDISEHHYLYVYYRVKPQCDWLGTDATRVDLDGNGNTEDLLAHYEAPDSCGRIREFNQRRNFTNIQGNVSITKTPVATTLDEDTVTWQATISNTGQGHAFHTFVYDQLSEDLVVASVVDTTNGVNLITNGALESGVTGAIFDNGNRFYVEVGDLLPLSGQVVLDITARLQDTNNDGDACDTGFGGQETAETLIAGWACDVLDTSSLQAFEDSLNDAACQTTAPVETTIELLETRFQLEKIVPDAIDLCDQDTMTIRVLNTGETDNRNITVVDTLPPGFEYIDNSTTFTVNGTPFSDPACILEPVQSSIGSGANERLVLTWDFSDPAVCPDLILDPSGLLEISYDFNTNCDYQDGFSTVVDGTVHGPCGVELNQQQVSPPIVLNVTGQAQFETLQTTLEPLEADGCQAAQGVITFENTAGSGDPPPQQNASRVLAIHVLSPGIHYVPSTASAQPVGGGTSTADPAVYCYDDATGGVIHNGETILFPSGFSDGQEVLIWDIDDLAPLAGGEIRFQYRGDRNCARDAHFNYTMVRYVSAIPCATVPAGQCDTIVLLRRQGNLLAENRPEITITKTPDTTPAVLGQDIVWTITATNTGNSWAPGFSLIDQIDAVNFSFISASHGGSFDGATNTVTWEGAALGLTDEDGDGTAEELAAGASVEVTLTVALASDQPGQCNQRGMNNLRAVWGCDAAQSLGNCPLAGLSEDESCREEIETFLDIDCPGIVLEKFTNGEDADDPYPIGAGDPPAGPVVAEGDTVTWTYLVYNAGMSVLSNVSVADSDATVTVSCPQDTLQPGESMTCTATGTAVAGQYENLAIVTATPPNGPAITDDDPSHYFGFNPSIDIEKATNAQSPDSPTSEEDADSAPGPYVPLNGTVNWTYVVTNTSDSRLASIVVTDDQGVTVTCPETALDPGASMLCTATGTALADQYENLATVTGTPVDAGGTPIGDPVTDEDFSHYYGVRPEISVEKYTGGWDADEAPGPFIPVGDSVTWTYVIFNLGNVPLTNVTLNDDRLGAITCVEGPIPDLDPDTSFHCTATGITPPNDTAAPGQYENIATTTGTPVDPDGNPVVDENGDPIPDVSDTDPSHYYNSTSPSILLEKHTNGVDADEADFSTAPQIPVGDGVAWSYHISNNGNTPLTSIALVDDQLGAITCNEGPIPLLDVGATFICTVSGTATAGQYANQGSVTGTPSNENGTPTGDPEVSDTDPSHYVGTFTAGIEVEKSTNGEDADDPTGPMIPQGDTVTWEYVVTNTGNTSLNNIIVTDDQGVAVTCPQTSLAVGGTMTCTASGPATAGQYENTATVTGTPVDENGTPVSTPLEDTDPSHYLGAQPAVDVEKATNTVDADTAPGPTVMVGGDVQWVYLISNTGNTHLTNVRLTDDQLGSMTCQEGPIPDLAPGDSFTCTVFGTATAGQYANTGNVDATPADENGDPITDSNGDPMADVVDTDPSHYFGAEASLDVEKATNGEDADTAPGPGLANGDGVTWTYVVTNNGNVDLTNVVVSDSQGVTVDCGGQTTLAAAASMTCTATGTAVPGEYENIATVSGQPPDVSDENGNPVTPDPVTDEDPSHYYVPTEPAIHVEKLTNGEDADTPYGPYIVAGATVTWTYTVTNAGNADLIDIQLSDSVEGPVTCPQDTLTQGESMTCTATGTALAEQYENSTTVTGTPVDGNGIPLTDGNGDPITVTDDDPSHYQGVNPSVTLEKFTNGAEADTPTGPQIPHGETVIWTFSIYNSGTVPLAHPVITDDQLGVVTCQEGPVPDLAPGERFICSTEGVATIGQHANRATVSAAPVDENGDPIVDDTGNPLPDVSDDDPSHYLGTFNAALDVEKSTNSVDADEGDYSTAPQIDLGAAVTWTYVVTNTGDVDLINIVVTDSQGVAVDCGGRTTLGVGESMTCSATGVAAEGQYENVANVSATPVDDNGAPLGPPVTDEDPSHYVGLFNPAIDLEKLTNGLNADDPTGPYIPVDGQVTWTYVIYNTGNVPLGDIALQDDQIGAITCREGPIPVILPDDYFSCSVLGTAQIGQYENQAMVTGTPVDETGAPTGAPVTDDDPSHYFGYGSEITVEKSTNGEDADNTPGPYVVVGDVVTWTYVVTNTGNIPLSDVTVADDQGVTIDCPQTTLAVAESMTCTAQGSATAGQYANLATAQGQPVDDQGGPLGDPVVDEDPSHYYGPVAAIDVEKATNGQDADSAPGPSVAAGDPVTWTYVVTNTGNTALANINVTDDQGVRVNCPWTTLAVGASMTCTGQGTATAGQYANLATVQGQPVDDQGQPVGDPVTDEDPSHYFGTTSTEPPPPQPPPLPPIIIDDPGRMSPIPFNAGSRGNECCLSLQMEHVTTSRTPDIIPVEGPLWVDTFNAMLAAAEFAGLDEDLSAWLRKEGIDPDRESLVSRRYLRMADKAGLFAAFNVGNITMQSGMGLDMTLAPDVRSAAIGKGISVEEEVQTTLQSLAAESGIKQIPDMRPLVLEYAGGVPIYHGDPGKGNLTWDRTQMDRSLVPLVWGTTLAAQAQLLPRYINSNDPMEQFTGRVMAWQMVQKVKLIQDRLVQTSQAGDPYVAHAYRMKSSADSIKFSVKTDEIRLSDQAALLWGLSRMRVGFTQAGLYLPKELDALTQTVWNTLERMVQSNAGTYADKGRVVPYDAMLISLALASIANDHPDLPMAGEAQKRLADHTTFMTQKLIATDGGVFPGYDLNKDRALKGAKTLVDQAAVLRALMVHPTGLSPANRIYAFMEEKLWDKEHQLYRDRSDWPMTGTYTPQSVGATVGGIAYLVMQAEVDKRVEMLDHMRLFFETIVAKSKLQQRGSRGLPFEGSRGLITGRGEITNLRRPIPVPSRRYRDDIIETGLGRQPAQVLVSQIELSFIPLEAEKLQALKDSIDTRVERFGPRQPLFFEPIRLPKLGPPAKFETAGGMLAVRTLMAAAPVLFEQGRITDDAFFTDPSMATHMATALVETARGSLVRLTMQSGNGVLLQFSAPVLQMAKAAGVTPEQALTDWLQRVAQENGLSKVPQALTPIFVEFAGGWPDYPQGLSQGWDVRGTDRKVSLAGLSQALMLQLTYMQAAAQNPADASLDGFIRQVTGLVVAAKFGFIEEALKAATNASLTELPSAFTLVRDSAGKVLDLTFADPAGSAFGRISLLGALGALVSLDDTTAQLVPDYAALRDKAMDLSVKVWDTIRSRYLDASGKITGLSLADAGLAAEVMGQMVQALPGDYPGKPEIQVLLTALADYLVIGKVTGQPGEEPEGPFSRDSLANLAAETLGLIRAREVLNQPEPGQAALDRFNLFDRKRWSKRYQIYLPAEQYEHQNKIRTTRYRYSAEDIGLTIGLLSRVMPLVDDDRKVELAERLSAFAPNLVEGIRRKVTDEISLRQDVDHIRPVELFLTDREQTYPGDILTFKITTKNQVGDDRGCGDLDDFRVRNVLPPGIVYIADSARMNARPIETYINGRSLTWNVGDLAMGETVTITFRARVDDTMGDRVHRDRAESGGYCFHPVDGGDTALCGISDDDHVALGAVNQIKGRIFFDSDGDGRRSPGDQGLANIRVILDENRATDTDNTGTYTFEKLLPGVYQMRVDLSTLPEDLYPTTDTVKTVILGAGNTYLVDFGLIRYQRIQGSVFDDRNGNEVQDGQEPGVAAVRVRIKGTDHTAFAADDGTFLLERIPEGIRPAVVIDKRQPYLEVEGATLVVEIK